MSLFRKLEDRRQAQESGVKVFLPDPDTGDETEFWILLCGPDTRLAANARRRAVTEVARDLEGKTPTTDDETEVGIRTLALCAISWNVTDPDGVALPCTYENAAGLFRNYPVLQLYCEQKAANRANFTIG